VRLEDDGWYVPFPETDVCVPTVVPPDVQVVGADDCGPNTVKVMVPVSADPPASVADIELAAIAVPAVPEVGPLIDENEVAAFATTVSAVDPGGQALCAVWLLVSPP
jgi:hypothetical protein